MERDRTADKGVGGFTVIKPDITGAFPGIFSEDRVTLQAYPYQDITDALPHLVLFMPVSQGRSSFQKLLWRKDTGRCLKEKALKGVDGLSGSMFEKRGEIL
jgi:hypothetical protein